MTTEHHLVEPNADKVDKRYPTACGRTCSKSQARIPTQVEYVDGLGGRGVIWEFGEKGFSGRLYGRAQCNWCPDCLVLVLARFHSTYETWERQLVRERRLADRSADIDFT